MGKALSRQTPTVAAMAIKSSGCEFELKLPKAPRGWKKGQHSTHSVLVTLSEAASGRGKPFASEILLPCPNELLPSAPTLDELDERRSAPW